MQSALAKQQSRSRGPLCASEFWSGLSQKTRVVAPESFGSESCAHLQDLRLHCEGSEAPHMELDAFSGVMLLRRLAAWAAWLVHLATPLFEMKN